MHFMINFQVNIQVVLIFNSYKRHESRFTPISVENKFLPTFDEKLYTNGPIIYVIEGKSGLQMMKVSHLGKCYKLNGTFP